jgi:hypothetical protein
VRLRFDLSARGRVFLVIRGPLPSCEVAVQTVRGRRGTNTLDFRGRVKRRQLRPGVYVLSISRVPRPVAGTPTVVVRVVSKRRVVALKGIVRDAACATATSVDLLRVLRPEAFAGTSFPKPTSPPATPAKASPLATASPTLGDDQDNVLGVAIQRLPVLGGGGPIGLLVALLFVALLGASIITLVTRFLRGSWNP